MIVKGYWEVTYRKKGYCGTTDGIRIIKAKNAQKAVQKFYTCDESWYQKNDYYVVRVEPHSVTEVIGSAD